MPTVKLLYCLEVPQEDLDALNKRTLQISDGNVGWGDVVNDTLSDCVRRISAKATITFHDVLLEDE